MRPAPPELVARIASGAATLCRCWKLTRRDGVVLGFTDHDRKLEFDEVSYEPESGFTASAIETDLGLSVGGSEAEGALSSERISAADIDAGLYDGAGVELWLVDWRDPATRYLLSAAEIGEITRGRGHFRAEMRGLAHRLNVPVGRSYQRSCDAALGDGRCRVNVTSPTFRGSGAIVETASATSLRVAGLEAYARGWFTRGVLTWVGGPNAGAQAEIKADRAVGASRWLDLWTPPPRDPAPGHGFTAVAGCDKRWETCRTRFGNHLNFRGFPHIPGDDAVNSYPNSGDNLNGGRLDG